MQPLSENGLHVHYIDESASQGIFIACSVQIPLISTQLRTAYVAWHDYWDTAVEWRRALSKNHSIRFRAELHGQALITGHGRLHATRRQLNATEAFALYADALATLTFLPDHSINTTFATDHTALYWASGIEAAMIGLFQRLRSNCIAQDVHGLIIFDDGHKEYLKWIDVHSNISLQALGWVDGSLGSPLRISR